MPETQAESEQLLGETRAVNVLEAEYAAELDFGGISTAQVGDPTVLMRPGRASPA